MILPFCENYLLITHCLLLNFRGLFLFLAYYLNLVSLQDSAILTNNPSPPPCIPPSRVFYSFTLDLNRIRLERIQALLETKCFGGLLCWKFRLQCFTNTAWACSGIWDHLRAPVWCQETDTRVSIFLAVEGRVRACLFSDNLYDISYANNLTLHFSFFFSLYDRRDI